MAKIKIFGSPLSQPTRAVLWTLAALDIPYEMKRIRAGDQFSTSFKKLNPNCKFPVLEENNFILDESHAIMRYICQKKPSSLYDLNEPKLAALVDKWLDWKHTYLRPGACGVVRRRILINMIKDKKSHSMFQDFEEIKASREIRLLNESLNTLQEHLSRNQYLVGSSPTIADVALVTELDQMRLLKANGDNEFDLKKWSNVNSWVLRVINNVKGYKETHEGLIEVENKLKSKL